MANPEIRSHFQVLSVDRPGYNYSKGSQIHNIEQQAEEIARLLDSDTLRPVYLVGRSFGAPVAAALAAIRPKLVKGLVLVAPAANPELEKFWWFSPILHYSPVRLFFPQAIRRASNEKYSHPKALKEMENLWGKVRCQTQILQGGKDEIVLPQNACYVDSMLVGAPHLLRMLPENGHLITSENPDLVVQLLLDLKSGRL
jgi:pimeloyl-ACP methyl ester carboxylesterase